METNDVFQLITEFIQPITLILVTVIGWGVKAVWNKVCSFDVKIDNLRSEIHDELQEYERKETCRAHREAINQRIDSVMAMRNGHFYTATYKSDSPDEED